MPSNCEKRRLLQVLWTARRLNQSILREIKLECSLRGLMLLQYSGHVMQTDDSLEKSLMLGKIKGRRRRGHQSMRCLDSITNAMNMNLGTLREMLRDREAWHVVVRGVAKNRTWRDDWTVALMVREWVMKMKREHEIWCKGSGDLWPLLDWGAESTLSPAFIRNCRLQDFLRSYLSQDTSCVNHIPLNVLDYTDIIQISLCLPQAVAFWASLWNN